METSIHSSCQFCLLRCILEERDERNRSCQSWLVTWKWTSQIIAIVQEKNWGCFGWVPWPLKFLCFIPLPSVCILCAQVENNNHFGKRLGFEKGDRERSAWVCFAKSLHTYMPLCTCCSVHFSSPPPAFCPGLGDAFDQGPNPCHHLWVEEGRCLGRCTWSAVSNVWTWPYPSWKQVLRKLATSVKNAVEAFYSIWYEIVAFMDI